MKKTRGGKNGRGKTGGGKGGRCVCHKEQRERAKNIRVEQ